MQDPKEAAKSLMRESRLILEQAKKYRNEIEDLDEDNPMRSKLVDLVRDLSERSKDLSQTAKRLIEES